MEEHTGSMPRLPEDPPGKLHRDLLFVEQPAQYLGGEFGSIVREDPRLYRVALSFPDLYQIGMSNTALKILYGRINGIPGVACERVFAPDLDFEAVLRNRCHPLYTLETKTPLSDCDVVAFTFGYELLATNMLTILDLGRVPLRCRERGGGDPLVIAGGPGITNPVPFGTFLDGVFIGEGDSAFPELLRDLAAANKQGAPRGEQLKILHEHPAVWFSGRTTAVHRALWHGFTSQDSDNFSYGVGFPVPSVPVVQDHGVVEIMRGCPQGCRFCHAGVYYRPYRMRSVEQILEEADWLIRCQGYRELSLSSLSSGDYQALPALMEAIHRRYESAGVSVQLPSLRVDSFTLPILEQLNRNRRAGLTFAVESAGEAGQRRNNKMVELARIREIARTAREKGWRRAKLYFMIGLPGSDTQSDAREITEFVTELRRAVPMEYVINVGTFVPKPHTPFQWEPQRTPEEALHTIEKLREALPRGCTLRTHDPRAAWVEGLIARGSEPMGEAIYEVWRRGGRFDAWGERLDFDLWTEVVNHTPGAEQGTLGRDATEPLPWSSIHMGVALGVLKRERERSMQGELTEQCSAECTERCGVCNVRGAKAVQPVIVDAPGSDQGPGALSTEAVAPADLPANTKGRDRLLFFQYEKIGPAAYLPHLALVRIFERLWYRMALPIALSEGHHRKPKMSFGQPLPLGVPGSDEIGVVELQKSIPLENLLQVFREISPVLPEGLSLVRMVVIDHEAEEKRIPAPMTLYNGTEIIVRPAAPSDEGDEGSECYRALARFLRACQDVPGAAVRQTTEVHHAHSATWARVVLPAGAPGIGRLLKESEARGLVVVQRTKLLPRDGDVSKNGGERLFDWYWHHTGSIMQWSRSLGVVE